MNKTRRSPRINDDLCEQVDIHFKNFNEEIERTLRDHQEDFKDCRNGSPFSDSRNSPDCVDGCIINIHSSPTRSQNSSPGLLSDYDRVSNSSSSFTSKTSTCSESDRFDDVKSTSSLYFESPCCNTENQLRDHHLATCCENLPHSIYDDCCDPLSRKEKHKIFCEHNHRTTASDVNSNKLKANQKNNNVLITRVDASGSPRRKNCRRPHKEGLNRIERNCDDQTDIYSVERSPDDNFAYMDQEAIQERLGCNELIKNNLLAARQQNGYHFDGKTNSNSNYRCDTSQNDNCVWVLRSDLKKPCSTEERKGRVFKDLQRFDLIDQMSEPLSTSSSSLPLTHANNNMRKSHSNATHRSTCNMFITQLGNKSSSAPILKKVNESQELLSSHIKVTKQPRSQSDKHLAEIQAAEACKWLRAAGFPQYAQMYEDHQFPIDLSSVKKDHSFLEPDSCKSLFRRLDTLNRCANIKVDSWRSNQDDSEDENQCALSQNWTFQPEQRRWSRTRHNEPLQPLQTISGLNTENIHEHSNTNSPSKKSTNSSRYDINLILDNEDISLSRSGSEKIKDGAKALLRRVESIKTRRRKKQNREGMVIYKDADILTINKTNNLSIPTLVLPKDNDSDISSQYSQPKILSPHSPVNSGTLSPRRILHGSIFHARDDAPRRAFVNRRGSVSLDRRDTVEVMSDSEVQRSNVRKSRDVEKLRRDGHLTVSDYDSDLDERDITRECRNSWHSIQIGITHTYVETGGLSLLSLTCGQLQVLRKLALLKLTGLIEKYCPTHKTGWNWELPKFIRKIKTPDYKNKAVFGVPLIVNLQRSGNPLPHAIQKAMSWLRKEAIDHVGLFRKSGVRSRIQALKSEVEKTNDFTLFDDQQSYDVADMIKQYFRELPEALLTTKLSETLILIFQHVPAAFRREAVSYVILLMPNEHCEVLQHILNFFQAITECSSENQMNASNLALCFAPSLFYYNQAATLSTNTRHNSVSPRRSKKATGTPDTNDLNENKAAYECLLYLIKHQKTLFIVAKEMLVQCKFSDLDQSKPLALAELGEHAGWKSYLEDCIHALQKEAKDRARGWINASGNCHNGEVDLAYKKVGDGHPLRLWRVATEVEAPPQEVLHRVLHERHIWDPTLIKVQQVQLLDPQSEIYQYQCASMEPLASRDYCVLRTWRTDLPRGACAIVETSVDHKNASLGSNSIRAVVLASRYLIEPCGSGKSRLMHFSRIDLMGRTPEWYNKCYGHVCRLQLCEIRNSFKHSVSVGPESKV